MAKLCTRHRGITNCPSPKQSHLGKCSNKKLCTSTLVDDETLWGSADFASALINVNNVKISDLVEFLVVLLFSSLCSHPKIIWKKSKQFWKHPLQRFSFDNLRKSPVVVSFHFHRRRCKSILEWLLSYEVTSWSFWESVKNQCQNK